MRNYLVEGVSCTGKTSVCRELRRRGHHSVNGDTELAYQGDPETGEPTDVPAHENHLWAADRVRALVANRDQPVTFLCGGSRNVADFVDLFDEVFVLEVDRDTLLSRLDLRVDEFGSSPDQRALILRLHHTREDVPHQGLVIDATRPLDVVVDDILSRVGGTG